MTLKALKGLQVIVGACVVGIVICFAMSVVIAVHQKRAEVVVNPATIPVPATPH